MINFDKILPHVTIYLEKRKDNLFLCHVRILFFENLLPATSKYLSKTAEKTLIVIAQGMICIQWFKIMGRISSMHFQLVKEKNVYKIIGKAKYHFHLCFSVRFQTRNFLFKKCKLFSYVYYTTKSLVFIFLLCDVLCITGNNLTVVVLVANYKKWRFANSYKIVMWQIMSI